MSTQDIIRPIINEIYGDVYQGALVKDLAERIDDWDEGRMSSYGRNREDMILRVIWVNWNLPGGDTAAVAAKRIEEALNA